MKPSYIDNDLQKIDYADLGSNFNKVIIIYESLISSELLDQNILSNFISSERNYKNLSLFYDYDEFFKYIYEENIEYPEIKVDFVDILLNSKVFCLL